MKPGYVLILNILLAIVWMALQGAGGPAEFLTGLIASFILLAVLHREYGRRVVASIGFVVFLLWSILKSSIEVAMLILSRHPNLDQGIVAIPLEATTDFEVALLATSITLTPGTLSVDAGHNTAGQRVLYVHNLVTGDPEAMRRDIKQQFEQRILRFTRSTKEK